MNRVARQPQTQPFTPDEVALLVDRAGRAPSVHNTQPWSFRAEDSVIELHADPRRGLAVADPQGRERLISCGAALFNLRLTMQHLGHRPRVTLLPDGPAGSRVAVIARGPAHSATAAEDRLYEAIPHRRTQRRPFDRRPLTDSQRLRLNGAAASENLWVRFLDDPALRRQVALLMAAAAAADTNDPAYRAELDGWIHGGRPTSDGIPLRSLDAANYPIDGLPWRDRGAGGPSLAAIEEELTISTVLVMGSLRDTPRDWLDTGQGLQHALLDAHTSGLVCSFANQLIELPALRSRLSALLAMPGYPQLILRVGHPLVDVPPTPRRGTAELFVESR